MNARMFALVFGIVYLLVGLVGFFVQGGMSVAPAGPNGDWPRLLGLFPINVLHNIVHLAIGIWGLLSYRSLTGSIGYARGLAILYGLLTILGLIPATNTTFGLIPIFGHDVWLHALTALVAAYFGWVATGRDETIETIDASRHRA
jgi:hypothetical protein